MHSLKCRHLGKKKTKRDLFFSFLFVVDFSFQITLSESSLPMKLKRFSSSFSFSLLIAVNLVFSRKK